MRSIMLGAAAATFVIGAAMAQSNPQTTVAPNPGAAGNAAIGAPAAGMGTMNPAGTTGMEHRNSNGAVNTSSVQQPVPATGANSFTQAQARGRITKHGYTNVSALKKDNDGIWRGTAQHDGQTVPVWLDYKGDVGQQ